MASCAGSAGGSQPPHRHPGRIPGQCEDDDIGDYDLDTMIPPPRPKKRKQGERGKAKGLKVQLLKRKFGGLIPLTWPPNFPRMTKPVGRHSSLFGSETGKVVRSHTPCYHRTWEEVDDQLKQRIWEELRSSFGPLDDIHYASVVHNAGELYRRWKNRLRTMIRERDEQGLLGCCPRDEDVSQEDWDRFLDIFYSEAFQKQSDRNRKNHEACDMECHQGRNSLNAIRWERLITEDLTMDQYPMGRDPIEVWARRHKNPDGSFLSKAVEAAYGRLSEARNRIAPCRPMTFEEEERVFKEALGARRDFLVGLSPIQSAASQASSSSSSRGNYYLELEQLKQKTQEQDAVIKKQADDFSCLLASLQSQVPGFKFVRPQSQPPNEDEEEHENENDA